MIAILWLSSALAACPDPVTTAELDTRVESVMDAFRSRDEAALARASDELVAALPCLEEPLDPRTAARWHAAAALTAIGRSDPVAAQSALRAAAFSSESSAAADALRVSPRAGELLQYNKDGPPSERERVRVPEGEVLLIDGSSDPWLGRDAQAILQHRGGADAELQTLLWTGDRPTSRWRTLFVTPDARLLSEPRRVALVAGGGASVLVAGAAFGAGLWNLSQFQDPDTPVASLSELQARSHRLSWITAGASLAAAGLGAALVVTW